MHMRHLRIATQLSLRAHLLCLLLCCALGNSLAGPIAQDPTGQHAAELTHPEAGHALFAKRSETQSEQGGDEQPSSDRLESEGRRTEQQGSTRHGTDRPGSERPTTERPGSEVDYGDVPRPLPVRQPSHAALYRIPSQMGLTPINPQPPGFQPGQPQPPLPYHPFGAGGPPGFHPSGSNLDLNALAGMHPSPGFGGANGQGEMHRVPSMLATPALHQQAALLGMSPSVVHQPPGQFAGHGPFGLHHVPSQQFLPVGKTSSGQPSFPSLGSYGALPGAGGSYAHLPNLVHGFGGSYTHLPGVQYAPHPAGPSPFMQHPYQHLPGLVAGHGASFAQAPSLPHSQHQWPFQTMPSYQSIGGHPAPGVPFGHIPSLPHATSYPTVMEARVAYAMGAAQGRDAMTKQNVEKERQKSGGRHKIAEGFQEPLVNVWPGQVHCDRDDAEPFSTRHSTRKDRSEHVFRMSQLEGQFALLVAGHKRGRGRRPYRCAAVLERESLQPALGRLAASTADWQHATAWVFAQRGTGAAAHADLTRHTQEQLSHIAGRLRLNGIMGLKVYAYEPITRAEKFNTVTSYPSLTVWLNGKSVDRLKPLVQRDGRWEPSDRPPGFARPPTPETPGRADAEIQHHKLSYEKALKKAWDHGVKMRHLQAAKLQREKNEYWDQLKQRDGWHGQPGQP